MKILFVLEYYPPHTGGVERLFETITRELARRGHAVRVITTQLKGYARSEERDGVHIERVRIPFDSRSLFSVWTIPKVVRAARWADVIHTSTFTAIPPASIAGTLTRTPTLITAHEFIGKRWFSLPRMNKASALGLYLAEHALVRFPAAHIAAVSDASRRDLIRAGVRPSKVSRVYNAMDETPWTDPENLARSDELVDAHDLSGRTVIVCYGRPGVTKGIEYAVRAFPLIRERIPNATLMLLTGTRPAAGRRAIESELERIGDEHVVVEENLPFQDLIAHVNLADVVIVPSLTEGFGYTTLESCVLGKRVVASRVGAIPEVIYGRYELVEEKNPEAIARGVVRVLKSRGADTRKKLFTAERMVDEYLAEYERIAP